MIKPDPYALSVMEETVSAGSDNLILQLRGHSILESLAILGVTIERVLDQVENEEFRERLKTSFIIELQTS